MMREPWQLLQRAETRRQALLGMGLGFRAAGKGSSVRGSACRFSG